MLRSIELGRMPIGVAVTTPVSIDAATALTVPTAAVAPGILECTVVVEGTVTARYTASSPVVTPTVAIGHLLPAPTATLSVTLLLRGRDIITNFRIIGTAGGDTMTYFFAQVDAR